MIWNEISDMALKNTGPSRSASFSLDRAMDRAIVENADPPRFLHIDSTAFISLLEQKSGLKLKSAQVLARRDSHEMYLDFGIHLHTVEVTLFTGNSHNTALCRMREAVGSISAPLDGVYAPICLGQHALQAVGGYGYILFVRDNIFIELVGLASSEELSKIAVDADEFLKGGEGVIESPRIAQGKVGEEFKVVDVTEFEAGGPHPCDIQIFYLYD